MCVKYDNNIPAIGMDIMLSFTFLDNIVHNACNYTVCTCVHCSSFHGSKVWLCEFTLLGVNR